MTDTHRQLAKVSLYSFGGGFADATSYLVFKTFTGHVTGNLILLTVALARGEWNGVLSRVVAIACFLACTSFGFWLAQNRRASVWLFVIQAALLLPVVLLPLATGASAVLGIAAFCCSLGLQNGVVTKALGVSVHSTFVSGDFTSLLKAGVPGPVAWSQGNARKPLTTLLLITLVFAFTLGALLAGCLSRFSLRAMPLFLLFPLCGAMLLGDARVSAPSNIQPS